MQFMVYAEDPTTALIYTLRTLSVDIVYRVIMIWKRSFQLFFSICQLQDASGFMHIKIHEYIIDDLACIY